MADASPIDAPRLWQAPALATLSWLAHGVTERTGGTSVAASGFAALNLGLHVGDDPDAVLENRRRAAHALGFSLGQLVCAEQVHGAAVAAADAAHAGRGATYLAGALPGADALITDTSGLLLALFFADCVPVLLADPQRRAVGVAHAGWRGMAAGVLCQSVRAMASAFGTRAGDVVAAIGPAIGPCCYEVGPEVAAHFDADLLHKTTADRANLDLPGVAARQLVAAGLSPNNVTRSGLCTACLPARFFSHRRDRGRTGRVAALIGIREETCR